MVKLMLAILLALLLFAYGIYKYGSGDSSKNSNPDVPNISSPSDTIDAAKGAVDQSQNLQDDIKSKASQQLNQ